MTDPFYTADRVSLWFGDSLELVKHLGEFDFLITDPPYPVGGTSSMKSNSAQIACKKMMDYMARSFLFHVIKSVRFKDDCAMWIMCDWRQVSFISTLLRTMGYMRQSCIVWDKQHSVLSALYHPTHELILFAIRGNPPMRNSDAKFLGRDLISLSRLPGNKKKGAFDKPLELVLRMCGEFGVGRALDPFCGTGGLLLGGHCLGWDCVGVDMDDDLLAGAIKNFQAQGELLS